MCLVRVREFTVESGEEFAHVFLFVAEWCKGRWFIFLIFVQRLLYRLCVGLEHVVFPENILSENHVSAAVLEDFECDRYFQAGGEGPGRVHLANGFLESAICKLQRATSRRLLLDAEAECLRIAVWRALADLIRGCGFIREKR